MNATQDRRVKLRCGRFAIITTISQAEIIGFLDEHISDIPSYMCWDRCGKYYENESHSFDIIEGLWNTLT